MGTRSFPETEFELRTQVVEMGNLSRSISIIMLLVSIYGNTRADSNDDAAELAEVQAIMRIRMNAGKGPSANMEEYTKELAMEEAKKENPGAEINEGSEEFLK